MTVSERKKKTRPAPKSHPKPREVVVPVRKTAHVDETYLVLVLLLLLIGLICLYSASYVTGYYSRDMESYTFILNQLFFAVLGLVAMFFASKLNYHIWHVAAPILLLGSTALLGTRYLIPSIWKTINNATRWIQIGISFQPSEISKFAVIVFFSSWAALKGRRKISGLTGGVVNGLVPFALCAGPTLVMIFYQPHLSATVTIAVVAMVILYLGGLNFKLLLGIGTGAAFYLVPKVTGILDLYRNSENLNFSELSYQAKRIIAWMNPFDARIYRNAGWQGAQSLLSIASGGVWGLGLGQGRQKHLFLPEPANDFIFAVICEELGFIGAMLIILLFVALILRGYYIAAKAPDTFGTLLAAGITTQIAVQTIFNMGVVSGILPVTGASLPFFSAGGTSLLMMLGEVGVLLSVSRWQTVDKKKKKKS